MINESFGKRQYESIDIRDIRFKGYGAVGSAKGVFIDKDNNKYNYIQVLSEWEEIKSNKQVLYVTKTKYDINKTNKEVKDLGKIEMHIDGYIKIEFIEERIKVNLE